VLHEWDCGLWVAQSEAVRESGVESGVDVSGRMWSSGACQHPAGGWTMVL
jgi:hypothetical protein